MNRRSFFSAAAVILLAGSSQWLCATSTSAATTLSGRVQLGGTEGSEPLPNIPVTLFEATEEEPNSVASTVTDHLGRFELTTRRDETDSIFFVTADVGLGVQLVAILGPELPQTVTVNELTSVAASYSMAQFFRNGYISGSPFPLRLAAMMNNNIVDVDTGESSPVLLASPNADETHSLRMTRSLANLLNASARNPLICYLYLWATTTAWDEMPANTAVATANLARDPGHLANWLYLLSKVENAYAPPLLRKPDAWTVTVKVNDSGDDNFLFGGPANVSFDSEGFAWIANNTIQGTPVSAERVMVLNPDGTPSDGTMSRPPSPIKGGGILGVGWGVTVDRTDTVWFGNFGWGGDDYFPTTDPIVSTDPFILGNGSVSKFSVSGIPLSGPLGYFGGTLRVQALKVDQDGNVWCASFGNDKVVVFPGGDPAQAKEIDMTSGAAPFGLAITPNGDAWLTNSGGLSGLNQSSVAKLRLNQNGQPVAVFSEDVGDTLKVIDVDSQGNAWLASQGDSTIYGYYFDGHRIGGFTGGGVNGPWGLCVDGEDNVWVANFGPLSIGSNFTDGRISKLCGANPASWPPGKSAGDPLSPETGYTVHSAGSQVLLHDGTPLYGYGEGAEPSFAPMMRQTSLQIDQAGNIWSINNWKPRFNTDIGLFNDGTIVADPDDANPGGDGIVIFVGLAPPPPSQFGR